jgi:hypothetical protein
LQTNSVSGVDEPDLNALLSSFGKTGKQFHPAIRLPLENRDNSLSLSIFWCQVCNNTKGTFMDELFVFNLFSMFNFAKNSKTIKALPLLKQL